MIITGGVDRRIDLFLSSDKTCLHTGFSRAWDVGYNCLLFYTKGELSGDFIIGYIQTDGRGNNSGNVYRRMLSEDEISNFTYVKSITSHSYVKNSDEMLYYYYYMPVFNPAAPKKAKYYGTQYCTAPHYCFDFKNIMNMGDERFF